MAAGFSRLSVMSVGIVERPIPSALLSEPSITEAPHTTMLPETSARPVSMTMLVFLTTSWWDPRPTLADSTLRQRCRRTAQPPLPQNVRDGSLCTTREIREATHITSKTKMMTRSCQQHKGEDTPPQKAAHCHSRRRTRFFVSCT